MSGTGAYTSRQSAIALAIVSAPYVESRRRLSHFARMSPDCRNSRSICSVLQPHQYASMLTSAITAALSSPLYADVSPDQSAENCAPFLACCALARTIASSRAVVGPGVEGLPVGSETPKICA